MAEEPELGTYYDIAIVGAGPAGAALASLLARDHNVALFDKDGMPRARIGESLVPGTRRLLRDIGLLDLIESRAYSPYLGSQSAWGSGVMEINDFMRDPDGPGWHLDRSDFEQSLRKAAQLRGTKMFLPRELKNCTYEEGRWRLAFTDGTQTHARIVVDATGRRATLARMLGVRPVTDSRTVAVWMRVKEQQSRPFDQGFSTISSCAEGWWYTAPTKTGRVVALHTDSDLVRPELRASTSFWEHAQSSNALGSLLMGCAAIAGQEPQIAAANTSILPRCSGQGWLAVGDAAVALDPLASRGIFQALYTSLAAATEIDTVLRSGLGDTFDLYASHLAEIAKAYSNHLDLFYKAEHRWADAPFWKRRHAA